VAGSQETPIRITSVLSHSIVSGEMVEVMVEGMDPERAASESEDQLQVQIVQEGISRSARIRNVAGVVVPDKSVGQRPVQMILCTMPRGLTEGEAMVFVSYRGQKSSPFKLEVASRPSPPSITKVITVGSPSERVDVERLRKLQAATTLRLERGKDFELRMF